MIPSRLVRRTALFLCVLVFGAGSTGIAQEPAGIPEEPPALTIPIYVPHPHRQMRDSYIWGTFGPPGLMAAAISAGLQQWRDSPEEWGQTRKDYYKRFAAEYATSAIGDTTKYAISRLRDEDPSFRPCECSGIHRRITHAVISPFIARKPDGRVVFSFARISAMTASSVIPAFAWSPTPQTAGDHIKHVGVSLAGTIGVDLLREFVLHHRKPKTRAPDPRGDQRPADGGSLAGNESSDARSTAASSTR